jgi:ABC-2 type transport system permease protein
MRVFCLIFLWKAIFIGSGKEILNGFTFPVMVSYLILSTCITECIGGSVVNLVHSEVKKGTIAMQLIKPISYRLRLYFSSLGDSLYVFVFLMIPGFIGMIIINAIYGSLSVFSPLNILFFVISFGFSIMINLSLSFVLGMVTFITTNMWGILQIYQAVFRLLSGALIPLSFFPPVFEKILTYLPFSSLVSAPANILLGIMNIEETLKVLIVQFVWLILLFLLTNVVWKKVVHRLVVNGG